ncbi:MAG: septum formation initiator family protein [Clostridia bacterium]
MRKTMNVWTLIAILGCVLIGFFCYSTQFGASIHDLDETYDRSKVQLADLESKQATLQSTLENVGTDAFIENQARTVYGYMKPNEIRFVITNPEALYGGEEVPSR